MAVDPMVEEHWPAIAALQRQLEQLTSDTHIVTVTRPGQGAPTATPTEDDTAEAIKRYNRRNGIA